MIDTTHIDIETIKVGICGYGFVGRAVHEVIAADILTLINDPAIHESTTLAELATNANLIFVCVPTPKGDDGHADLRIVHAVLSELSDVWDVWNESRAPGVIVKSTVPPGSLDELQRIYPKVPLLANPEFLRERCVIDDLRCTERVIVGTTEVSANHPCLAVALALFRRALPDARVVVTTARTAELTKYASNALLASRVAFANELYELAERIDVDYDEVQAILALDQRIGSSHLQVPGPDGLRGFGGSCFPKDTRALLALARDVGANLSILEAVVASNERIRGAGYPDDAPSTKPREVLVES
ncbi:UDP-glucose/GDP-mannose dehydrogenase family protein [Lujinxingia vulgaris]|uniref:UDP-glucose/GDP-mannose dehydrogenase family protein n=1 Tax=Lujinxingia vulgaris TaxID=2600176 RepID=A0A5C6X7Y6_9DELT|nr:UDP-glucose/GDP-mannose dehydrogenase family protein [Lujinxingia vulgaris]TXD37438.1 UDP-glucose/GDP-mannose dehydrogenase family protein [Lujinxingia vulgaris]